MIYRLACLLGVLLTLGTSAGAGERPLTVLISIDGFRPDYLDRGVTPVLSRMAREGVRAAMRPAFPTKTFPNHYTLVTGLRPDHHGIVDNTMEDPAIAGVRFTLGNATAVTDARWWNDATPIWVTAERVGIRTATMFWPGSEAAIQGVRPSQWRQFDQGMAADARVDQVLAWLDLSADQRPALVTLYFDEVDTAGHQFGPESAEVNTAAARTDAAIGRLVEGLSVRGRIANLVIVADHGMAGVSEERQIQEDAVLPQGSARLLSAGAFVTVYPSEGRVTEVEAALLPGHPHLPCWRKGELPARFHYGRHRRVAPIICLPDVGWQVVARGRRGQPFGGAHGYDPAASEMAAIFIGYGPAFLAGVDLPPFDNVDVYPLLARLLGVTPAANEGSLSDLAPGLTR